jgi:hypothetical protein
LEPVCYHSRPRLFYGGKNGLGDGAIQRVVWSKEFHCDSESLNSVRVRLGETFGVDLIVSEQSGALDGVVVKMDDSIPHGLVPKVELCHLWGCWVVFEACHCVDCDRVAAWNTVSSCERKDLWEYDNAGSVSVVGLLISR